MHGIQDAGCKDSQDAGHRIQHMPRSRVPLYREASGLLELQKGHKRRTRRSREMPLTVLEIKVSSKISIVS